MEGPAVTSTHLDPAVSLRRLHAALVAIGDGLVRGSAADLVAAEAELSALVRELPGLVEAVGASRDRTAFTDLVHKTHDALARARALGRNVELTFREAEEHGGRLAAYGRTGVDTVQAPQGALDARG